MKGSSFKFTRCGVHFGEKTPTVSPSSLTATPISANTASRCILIASVFFNFSSQVSFNSTKDIFSCKWYKTWSFNLTTTKFISSRLDNKSQRRNGKITKDRSIWQKMNEARPTESYPAVMILYLSLTQYLFIVSMYPVRLMYWNKWISSRHLKSPYKTQCLDVGKQNLTLISALLPDFPVLCYNFVTLNKIARLFLFCWVQHVKFRKIPNF